MSSQQQINGTRFEFNTIASTQIITVQNELSLPYNPFAFDMTLRIIKSIQPYQSDLIFNIPYGYKSIFGRNQNQVQHVLKANTVSKKHFGIDQNKKIYDLGSLKGTFIWIQRQKPIQIYQNIIFLIGKVQLKIKTISPYQKKAILELEGKTREVSTKQNPLLLGNHKNCQIKIEGKDYYAAIDMINMRLYTYLQKEDCNWQKGVWLRLSKTNEKSQGRILLPQDIIMVFPYIFITQY